MKLVLQKDVTGCGFACVAMLAGTTYKIVKNAANQKQISVEDPKLWSETKYIRTLLTHFGINISPSEKPFQNWNQLPNLALLAIKWHQKKGDTYWHWTIFVRKKTESYVLDPKSSLKKNKRTDFGRIKPKWYIEII